MQPLLILAVLGDYTFWIVIVALMATMFGVTYFALRKMQSVWRQFASLHGLEYSRRPRPLVTGQIAGRHFELLVSDQSSDRGLLGIQEVLMKLRVETGLDQSFHVTNEGALLTAVREAAGDDQVAHLDGSDFDSRTCLHTSDVEAARAFLSDSRRAAFLALIEDCPDCDVHLTETELRVGERTGGNSIDQLNQRLAAMCKAANAIEADSPQDVKDVAKPRPR